MKLRNGGLILMALVGLASCDKAQDRDKPAVAPVTQGGSADPWSAQPPPKDPLKKPLFWKAEKDGKTTYFLGTMHMGVDPTSRIPDAVFAALDEKPTFAMETDLADAAKLDLQRRDGTTLKDELGPEYWKKLEDALGAAQAAQLNKLKPMVPATLISLRGLPQTAPMDGVLHARATRQNKHIVFLEPFELQATVLLKWMNARALKDMLDDIAGTDARAKKMLDAYVAGEGEQLMAVFEEERAIWKKNGRPESEFDEQMTDLLYKRNASWIASIEKLHAEGGGFVAVGAAHLIGPGSVLDLLEKQGYKVTRVTP
jgi:uncharacterized protein YbaP (TraB family)